MKQYTKCLIKEAGRELFHSVATILKYVIIFTIACVVGVTVLGIVIISSDFLASLVTDSWWKPLVSAAIMIAEFVSAVLIIHSFEVAKERCDQRRVEVKP